MGTAGKKEYEGVPFEKEIREERKQARRPGTVRRLLHRWFIDGMGAMALGLFSSLIIGLIISQLARIPGMSFLEPFAEVLSASSPVVGAAIGVAVAYGLKTKPLVLFSSAATGAFGYMAGGPVGAYAGALAGAEIGSLVAGRTPVDILVSPLATIVSGCLVGSLVGSPLNDFMTWLGEVINAATVLSPFPMSIAVAVIVGMTLTAPISSAALCIMLGLDGLAAGAACMGCCAQMMGFAAMSIRQNGWGGFLAQGLGTSMLQFPNILRHPIIWVPPTATAAICGPIATVWLGMTNTATGAGMGTSGLVGQFGAWAAMEGSVAPGLLLIQILLVQFLLPAVLSTIICTLMEKAKWISPEYLKLPEL